MTVGLIQGLLLTFALIVILMPPYIRLLHAVGFGKRIRVEGPESHYIKEGTPTMGGLLVVVVVLAVYFILQREPDASTFAPIAALAGVGLLGAFDDYLNARTGEGIRVRQKLIWLTVVAFVAAYQIQQTYNITAIAVPFVGPFPIDPWVYVLFAAFAIVATANGVNITDGLDGLSGGTVAIAFVAYMLIALLNAPLAQPNLALLCSLIIGALLGFLWFNVHPAQIFIGDSGALSLGATLAVTALITGQILVLPLIGIIFVVETVSVIVQVGYFRLSGGKRLLRMSPIHHHFELGGWDEEKITIRFWNVGLAALLGVTLFVATLESHDRAMTMTIARPLDPDTLTMDGIRAGALRDRAVTVLGFARSGIALARFLADAGARVTIYDGRPAEALSGAVAALEGRQVRLLLGPGTDPAEAWAGAELVTTSPSINPDYPTTEPRLRAALRALVDARSAGARAVPAVVSEPDLFLRLCPSPTIGITGTKGKTTTASLIATILAADAAHPVVLGGNIGVPIVERLPELTAGHRVVDELSELQLPTLSRGTTVAVYTNVTADHLDRHGSLERYRAAKRRLAELVDPDGALVLNLEDPIVAGYADIGRAPVVGYRRDAPPSHGLGVVDGWIVADEVPRLAVADGVPSSAGDLRRIMPVDELAVPGAHNVSNALAAVAVGLLFGLEPAAIRAAAASFRGVEHRLEPVALIDGVRFVNDSQGTQPDAVIAALRAFDGPIVLIAGGRGKDLDLSSLGPVVAERAVAAVLIGESGPDLERRFHAAGLARTERAASLEAAVRIADAIAREALAGARAGGGPASAPATVLLSPAAASFDMFADYAARGAAFKAAVAELAAERDRGGDR